MARQTSSTSDVLLYFLAIFVPPASVGIKRGCGADILINICLWVLAWIPGVIHAWWIISKYEEPSQPKVKQTVPAHAYPQAPPQQQPYPQQGHPPPPHAPPKY